MINHDLNLETRSSFLGYEKENNTIFWWHKIAILEIQTKAMRLLKPLEKNLLNNCEKRVAIFLILISATFGKCRLVRFELLKIFHNNSTHLCKIRPWYEEILKTSEGHQSSQQITQCCSYKIS